MATIRAAARLAVWTAALVGIARLLLAAGSPSLSIPLTSTDALTEWVSTAPPADMAMGVLRLAALGATLYLLALTALAVAARLTRLGRLASAVDLLAPDLVRRIVTGGSGVGLVLGAAVASLPVPDLGGHLPDVTVASSAGAASFGRTQSPGTPATMARVPRSAATIVRVVGAAEPTPAPASAAVPAAVDRAEATMTRIGQPTPPSATMTRLDPVLTDESPASTAAATPGTPATSAGPAIPPVDATAWVVEPGDSFWSIAVEVTGGGASPGSPVDERAVTRYWRRIVDANRPGLVDPANPDLLVPGQRLVVPPPAG
jgi:LysM domain